jgi:nicotinamide-nucleotide amidase
MEKTLESKTTRSTPSPDRIALLATGDEIINGDILNTNTQEISRRLFDNGMRIGMHMTASDNLPDIESAMTFLLNSHRGLIITGGLGPTSDDITRFALSHVLQKPLLFNEKVWDTICERIKKFGHKVVPESNRQQALFPEGSQIIPNANGTAAGCYIYHENKIIFMLPGPPFECFPMIDTVMLPELAKAGFQQKIFHKSWYLFGVSEAKMAEELEEILKSYDCIPGYRIFYPYLEFKIQSKNEKDFNAAIAQIEKIITPHLIGNGKQIASELLRKKLETTSLKICDEATGGLLESTLTTSATFGKIYFVPEETADITIKGLKEFWSGNLEVKQTELEFVFGTLRDGRSAASSGRTENSFSVQIPAHGVRVRQYAMEFICREILRQI